MMLYRGEAAASPLGPRPGAFVRRVGVAVGSARVPIEPPIGAMRWIARIECPQKCQPALGVRPEMGPVHPRVGCDLGSAPR